MTMTEQRTTEPVPTLIRGRKSMPSIVGGGVLVLIGLLWLLERTGVVDLSVTAVLALATMVVGIALMVLATDGSHGGLITFGAVLAVITLITATAPFEGFQGGVGDREIEVTTTADIASEYNLAMGNLTIDLSEIDDLDAETRLEASVGTGELVVRVPAGIDVAVNAEVGAGQLVIFDRTIDGLGIDETYESPGFADSDETLTLDLQVFTGRVEVTDE